MAAIVLQLFLVGLLLVAVAICALAPIGFMGMMFWRWHRELSQLRQGRAIRLTPVPVRQPALPSVLVLPAGRAVGFNRRAS